MYLYEFLFVTRLQISLRNNYYDGKTSSRYCHLYNLTKNPTFCQIRKNQCMVQQFYIAHMVSFCDKPKKSFEEHDFSKILLFHTALIVILVLKKMTPIEYVVLDLTLL